MSQSTNPTMEASRRPTAAGGQAGNKINLSTLNPQQLQMLKEQFENELQSFSQSAITLQKAAGEFHSGARAIEELGQRKQGRPRPINHSTTPHLYATHAYLTHTQANTHTPSDNVLLLAANQQHIRGGLRPTTATTPPAHPHTIRRRAAAAADQQHVRGGQLGGDGQSAD